MQTPCSFTLSFFVFLIFTSVSLAQNGQGMGPPWKVLGNNINDTKHFIGTTNAAALVIATDDTERARVTETGRVGIGLDMPGAKLMILSEDDLATSSALNIVSASSNPLLHVRNDGKTGIGTNSPGARLMVVGLDDLGSSAALNIISASSNPLMHVKNDGKTGLGTTSPLSTLQVHNGSDAGLDANASPGYLIVGNPAGNNIVLDNNEIMARDGANGGGSPAYSSTLHMQADGGDVIFHNNLATSNKVKIQNDGKVGIGTTSPTTMLDLHGNMSFDAVEGDRLSLFGDRIGDADMYGFGIATNVLYYKANGSHKWYSQGNPGASDAKMTLNSQGFLGLGTESPNVTMVIEDDNARLVLRDGAGNNSENSARLELLEYADGNFNEGSFLWWNGDADQLRIGTKEGGTNTNVMVINHSGLNVGIGTTTLDDDYRLSVNGKIRAKEIRVETGWPDWVFEPAYVPPTLEEVEQHIKKHGHLPDIPSAKEVEENGVALGEMNSKLLQKIEELTLYMIDMKKENDQLKKRIETLEDQLD